MDQDGHVRLEDVEGLLRQTLDAVNALRQEQAEFRNEFRSFREEQQAQNARLEAMLQGPGCARRWYGRQNERNGRAARGSRKGRTFLAL